MHLKCSQIQHKQRMLQSLTHLKKQGKMKSWMHEPCWLVWLFWFPSLKEIIIHYHNRSLLLIITNFLIFFTYSWNAHSQAYILISLIPLMISFITLTLLSVTLADFNLWNYTVKRRIFVGLYKYLHLAYKRATVYWIGGWSNIIAKVAK